MTQHGSVYTLIVLGVCLALALTGCSSRPAMGSADNPIVMSFAPEGDPVRLSAAGHEIARMLSSKTGLHFKVTVGTSTDATIEAMGANLTQVAWLDTFGYLLAHRRYGVRAGLTVVRNKKDYYNSQIIIGNPSEITQVTDLRGRKFCFTDPHSPTGFIIPHIMLRASGLNSDRDLLVSTDLGYQNNVISAVYKRECDAGATSVDARISVRKDYPDILEKTAVLLVSPDIPNDAVCFTQIFPSDLQAKISQALLEIANTEDGKKNLSNIFLTTGLIQHDDRFYDSFADYLSRAGVDVETLVAK